MGRLMRRWISLVGLLAGAAGAVAFARGCGEGVGGAPFTDRLPLDAVLYVGAPDVRALAAQLRAHPVARDPAIAPLLELYARHEARLSGPAALIGRPVSGRLEWTLLLSGSVAASGEIDGLKYETHDGRIIVAETRDAIRRFREAPHRAVDFAVPGGLVSIRIVPRAFPGAAWSVWCARWRDFDAIEARLDISADAIAMRALARYAPEAYGHAIEHLIQAPRLAGTPADAAAWTTQMEHAPRLWQEILDTLPIQERHFVEREAPEVGRELGRPFDEVIARLGPSWSAAVTRDGRIGVALAAHEMPRLADATRHAIARGANAAAEHGRALRVAIEEDLIRVDAWRGPLRAAAGGIELGELALPFAPGEYHAGTVIDVPALRAVKQIPNIDMRSLHEWLDRFAWMRRVEAWTRYTDAGARVEARVTYGER